MFQCHSPKSSHPLPLPQSPKDCSVHQVSFPVSTLFIFFIILFYFVTLQYCIGFAIYQHESATGIHVFPILNPPPSLYHPSGSSQCISPKHPVLCIEPGLATRFIYDIIRVSMPFSQIFPPSPSMIQQSHCWAYTLRKPEGKETRVPQCSSQHCL